MSRAIVEHAGAQHLLAFPDDEPRAPGAVLRVVVRVEVLDEITGRAPPTPVVVVSDRPGLAGRATAGGVAGCYGVPVRLFPEDAALWPVPLTLRISASGFVPVERAIDLPLTPGFPDDFLEHRLPAIALHREPVAIAGTVTHRVAGARVPFPGVDVTVARTWRQLPDPTAPSPGEPPRLVAIHPPLSRALPAGVGRLRGVTPAWQPLPRSLVDTANAGTERIRLDRAGTLAPGHVLAIDADDPHRVEYAIVDQVEPPALPGLSVSVRLTEPLALRHAARALVRRLVPVAPSAIDGFDRDAVAGDRCLFLDAMNGLPGALVAIDDGGPPAAYHVPRVFAATTDADGRYRLPPISRVAQVRVRADDGAGTVVETLQAIDYTRDENVIDIDF